MDTFNNIKPTFTLNCKGNLLVLDKPKIMGILNVTPDSFFDGGRFNYVDNALKQAEKMLIEGADILDIGGQSTRPMAKEVDEEEELKRTVPIIEALSKHFKQAIISIDTYRAKVAMECVNAGAAMVNDVSAGDNDAGMIDYVVSACVPYIIMHKQGNAQTMQQNPQYANVVAEVITYLGNKIALLHQRGVHDIIADPGFGFGKTLAHNYSLLKNLKDFALLGVPLLAGISRKSIVNKVLNTLPQDALNGTTVLNTIALLNGAQLLRVHDVKEAKQAILLVEEYKRA